MVARGRQDWGLGSPLQETYYNSKPYHNRRANQSALFEDSGRMLERFLGTAPGAKGLPTLSTITMTSQMRDSRKSCEALLTHQAIALSLFNE